MKRLLTIILFLSVCFFNSIQAAALPAVPARGESSVPVIARNNAPYLNLPFAKKLRGRRITFLQKTGLRILQKIVPKKHVSSGQPTERQRRLGKISMILGISSIVLLVIPYVAVLSIPAAILAVVLGAKSLKGNSNTNGLLGVITGGVALLLLIIAIIAVAVFISAWR